MIKSYKLFTTPMCPKCPAMKEFMAGQEKVEGKLFDAHTEDGLTEARKYNVSAVPMVIFFDEKDEEVKRVGDVGEVKSILSEI